MHLKFPPHNILYLYAKNIQLTSPTAIASRILVATATVATYSSPLWAARNAGGGESQTPPGTQAAFC